MTPHTSTRFLSTSAAALVLCSCAVKNGQLDFTWWQDAATPVMEDEVIIENSGGHYHYTPAPARIPEASIPKEAPEEKPEPQVPASAPIAAQQQPATQAPSAAPTVHTVRPGDTLSALARRYNTTVRKLVEANGMANANVPLRVNQQLRLPAPGSAPAAAVSKPRPAAATPAAPAAAPRQAGTHTVKAGDTIYKISRQYGVAPAALMQANGLTPATANTIRVGTTLRIPATR